MAVIDSTWLGQNGSPLGAMIRAGENSIADARSAGGSMVDAANAGASAMRGDAASMRDQARLVNTQADATNRSADQLAALVPQLDPYKDKLTNYGDDLNAIALGLQTRADDIFGQAGALTSLDPNATGLAGEYMKQYDLLSPDRYVSRYASDAQSDIDNTRGQTERFLARRGVNVGSGAAAGLMNNLQRIKEAAVLAAAKTMGYDKGVTERGNWLGQMTSAAKTFFDMGTEQQSQALTAKTAAGDMAKGAAGIVAQQGDMTKDVAAIRALVADLYAKGADIFGAAGQLEGSAGKLTVDAYNSLTSAMSDAVKYYQGISQSMLSADAQVQAARIAAESRVASAIAS